MQNLSKRDLPVSVHLPPAKRSSYRYVCLVKIEVAPPRRLCLPSVRPILHPKFSSSQERLRTSPSAQSFRGKVIRLTVLPVSRATKRLGPFVSKHFQRSLQSALCPFRKRQELQESAYRQDGRNPCAEERRCDSAHLPFYSEELK